MVGYARPSQLHHHQTPFGVSVATTCLAIVGVCTMQKALIDSYWFLPLVVSLNMFMFILYDQKTRRSSLYIFVHVSKCDFTMYYSLVPGSNDVNRVWVSWFLMCLIPSSLYSIWVTILSFHFKIWDHVMWLWVLESCVVVLVLWSTRYGPTLLGCFKIL